MKKLRISTFAIAAAAAYMSSMTLSAMPSVPFSHVSFAASAAEASGNLIVQITGLPALSGVTVTVTGGGKTLTAVTDDKGQAAFSKLPVTDAAGEPITYTIQEIIPDGYLAASSLTTTLAAGSTVIASIPNTEKTFTIAIDCMDHKTGSVQPSGDAVLSGGSFTIRHDGEAYGTYAIGAEGKLCEFTLHGKEYEGDWTIQMTEAPEGYFLESTVQDLGYYYEGNQWVSLTDLFPQYTHATMHLTMIPISGVLQITADPGDQIQVYLQSAGSYEDCRASERATLTLAEGKTTAMTEYLPYGTYVVDDLTTGTSAAVKIENYGEIVPIDLTESTPEPISRYRLYDKSGKTLLSSGEWTENGTITLPENGITEAYYLLVVEQGNADSSIGTSLTSVTIVLHADGSYDVYEPEPSEENKILYGDVNLDGKVDLTDAILLNKALSGAVQLTANQQFANADCDANSALDANDSIALLQFLVHAQSSLPVK